MNCGCSKRVPSSGMVPHGLQGGLGTEQLAPLLEHYLWPSNSRRRNSSSIPQPPYTMKGMSCHPRNGHHFGAAAIVSALKWCTLLRQHHIASVVWGSRGMEWLALLLEHNLHPWPPYVILDSLLVVHIIRTGQKQHHVIHTFRFCIPQVNYLERKES